ncbi:MAG: U32 family peptidase [Lachnospiraceae bacterium]|nr:U32 family peptidase [Lachnospiraceae bacterium]
MGNTELLAPCGSYDAFLAAVNAGADAVYLAGEKFGARAYAENFTTKKLIEVISQAHDRNVKVYLTLNTLLRDEELLEVEGYLSPLVEAGLDGIIVQDLGVCKVVKDCFPSLSLHISTQMSVSSVDGALFAKHIGAERVVPSRELSLTEIKELKAQTGLELETFIHGAMCYCYSGQCLMSSFLGGRSGNRGRCAQPCRLPYHTDGKDAYFLSLKDMNTLQMLPELIDAGIDSFKVEGRMKRPEYVGGVISIYRKYIDLYLQHPEKYRIDPEDEKLLSTLYIRSETGDGYYHKTHGKDMVSLHNPAYTETPDTLLQELHQRFVHPLTKIADGREAIVDLFLYAQIGEPMMLTATVNGTDLCTSLTGEVIPEAQKAAATEASIKEHLMKLGDTPFTAGNIDIALGEGCFIPVKWINALRREVLEELSAKWNAEADTLKPSALQHTLAASASTHGVDESGSSFLALSASVMTLEQLRALPLTMSELTEVILDDRLFMEHRAEVTEVMRLCCAGKISQPDQHQMLCSVRLPRILRGKDQNYLAKLFETMLSANVNSLIVSNLDSLGYALKYRDAYAMQYPEHMPVRIIADPSLYHWNKEALLLTGEAVSGVVLPLELNSTQLRLLMRSVTEAGVRHSEAVVYGRAPLMVSANCIRLTDGTCKGKSDHSIQDPVMLTDRKGISFPVYTNCRQCFNILYNSLPTAIYEDLNLLVDDGIRHFRMDFTLENAEEVKCLTITYIQALRNLQLAVNAGRKALKDLRLSKERLTDPVSAAILQHSTSGHLKRGVL